MLGLATRLLCDCCDDTTSQFERGWRAHLEDDGSVRIVCPVCAESVLGEDETA